MLDTANLDKIKTYPCPNCYLCQLPGEPLYQQLSDRLFGAQGKWNFKQCQNPECELIWLDPMPHADDLGKAYERYFTHEVKGRNFVKKDWLRELYHQFRAVPSSLLGLGAANFQYDHMYLSHLKPGRLLEVGCGDGKFLHQMHLARWDVKALILIQKLLNLCA
jgi:hypothetical protein